MIWTLRYKKPQGVGIVQIETASDEMEAAKKLGNEFVNSQPGPAYRFISVERWIVASDVTAKQGSAENDARKADKDMQPRQANQGRVGQ